MSKDDDLAHFDRIVSSKNQWLIFDFKVDDWSILVFHRARHSSLVKTIYLIQQHWLARPYSDPMDPSRGHNILCPESLWMNHFSIHHHYRLSISAYKIQDLCSILQCTRCYCYTFDYSYKCHQPRSSSSDHHHPLSSP